MAAEDATSRDTGAHAFEEIDWDRIDARGGRSVDGWAITEAAILVGLLAGFVYDYSAGTPTELIGLDPTAVEWLFSIVLVLGTFHVAVPLAENPRLTARYWRTFRKNRVAVGSLGFLLSILALGVVGPMIWVPPNETIDFATAYRPPVFAGGSWAHALGTDAQGRHLWHLIVYGMRVSMEVGLVSTAIAISIGTVVGATAAHVGGYVDEGLMRYVDLQQTFPVFVLLLFLVYLFGPSLLFIVVLYGFFGWEGIGRLVRSETLQRTEAVYVRAAEAAGAGRWWIVRRHLIPNVSGTVITAATLAIPTFILGEAALAFLGFSDPAVFSWGRTIAAGRSDLASAPWISTIPGVFLFLTVLAFNFVGDALRDAMDPR